MRPPARPTGLAGLLLAATLLSACAAIEGVSEGKDRAEPEASTAPAPANAAAAALPVPQPGAPPTRSPLPTPSGPVPHIYMALQPGGEGMPISAIFAIDAARDNTPSDDQAIRLTPKNGKCNPQEMRSFNFPPEYAAAPVATEADRARGLTAADLPAFMAVSVTDMMIARGLASDREQTRALNICTRKLWEELVLAENRDAPVQ